MKRYLYLAAALLLLPGVYSCVVTGEDDGPTKPTSTDSHGTDSHGTDSHGTDSHGTDSHGTDSHGTDSHGTDSHGTDSQDTDLDIECPTADFSGCIDGENGAKIALNCEEGEAWWAEECTSGTTCVVEQTYQMAICDDGEGQEDDDTRVFPNDVQNYCTGKADGSYCYNASNNGQWQIFCQSGSIVKSYSGDCTSIDKICGQIEENGQIYNVCIADYNDDIASFCDSKADGSYCITAKDNNEWQIFCEENQVVDDYTMNCNKYGYTCGQEIYQGQTYELCVYPTDVNNFCIDKDENIYCFTDSNNNIWQIYCYENSPYDDYTADCTAYDMTCGPVVTQNNTILNMCKDIEAEEDGCQQSSDCSGTVENGEYICNNNHVCEIKCTAPYVLSGGKCIQQSSGDSTVDHQFASFDFTTGKDADDTVYNHEFTATKDGATITIIGRAKTADCNNYTGQGGVTIGLNKDSTSKITISNLPQGIGKLVMDVFAWDGTTVTVKTNNDKTASKTLTKNSAEKLVLELNDASATSLVITGSSRTIINNIGWTDAK